jgi:Arc/MetJ family transcription regulator
MKRTNLMLDEHLLEEATRELGLKTYSATVNKALEELVRIRRIQRIPSLIGKVRWRGNLSEMREDHPRRPAKKRKQRL